jgi:hypothetical protein
MSFFAGACVGEGRQGRHVRLEHQWPKAIDARTITDLLARETKAGRFDPARAGYAASGLSA